MPEYFDEILKFAIDSFQGIFSEALIGLLLLGLVLLLIGLFLLVAMIHTRITGRRVQGKVVGAIKELRVKEKERGGKLEKETKESLWPVFEYPRPDGSLHREKGSAGGSGVLNYETGQTVNLLVRPRKDYDEVSDADRYGTLIAGGILVLVGAGIVILGSDMLASLALSGFTLFILLVAFGAKFFTGRKTKQKATTPRKHFDHFDPETVRPIEELKQP